MILRFFVELGFERATWRKNEVGGEIPESPLTLVGKGLEEVDRAHVWVSVGESHVQKLILAGIARLHSLTPYDPIISDTELCPMDVDMI